MLASVRSLPLIHILLLSLFLLLGTNASLIDRSPSPCDEDEDSPVEYDDLEDIPSPTSTVQAAQTYYATSVDLSGSVSLKVSSISYSILSSVHVSSSLALSSAGLPSYTSKQIIAYPTVSYATSVRPSQKSSTSSAAALKPSSQSSTTTRALVTTTTQYQVPTTRAQSTSSLAISLSSSTPSTYPAASSTVRVTPTTTTSTISTVFSSSITRTSVIPTTFSTLISASKTSSQALPAAYTPIAATPTEYSYYKDSAHFRVYAAATDPVDETLNMLEGEFDCFVNRLKWRSSGLSAYDANNTGPVYKTNILAVPDLGGSAGQQRTDYGLGVAYLAVVTRWLAVAGVTAHEYGHALHYHQQTWVGQARTGAWWETVAQWIADTYQTSDLCSASRDAVGRKPGPSMIDLGKVIGDSFQIIVDGSGGTGNYYQAWPFLTYMTNNPDGYKGLGSDVVRQLMVQYAVNSNEDPLHTLARVAGVPVATIVGRYWARMAYVDIGSSAASTVFDAVRGGLNYVNVQQQQPASYQVLPARKPRYMGANIVPLNTTNSARLAVDLTADREYTATLVIRNRDTRAVRYLDLVSGKQAADIAVNEEASLVVANTPSSLILYNAFALTDDVQAGLSYSFTLTGATVASVALA